MSVKIGHASIDERGDFRDGKPGDQTGKEVCIRDWYSAGWNKVIRPNKAKRAEKIAKAMEEACRNDNIGYSQSSRSTLYTEAKEKQWEISKITQKCNTDCSALVRVCVCAAGIEIGDIYTGNEAAVLKNTGKFTILTDKKYTDEDRYLKRGDILLKEGIHTAIVLTNGEKCKIIKSKIKKVGNKK